MKRSALLNGIQSTQTQAKADRERKQRSWQEHQKELDRRLHAERSRIKSEHSGAEEELRIRQARREAERATMEAQRVKASSARKASDEVDKRNREAREARFKEERAKEAEEKAAHIKATISGYRANLNSVRLTDNSLNEEWAALEIRAMDGALRLHDIPFPSEGALRRQIKDKKTFKSNSLRWHPDKFTQKFGSQLFPAEKGQVLQEVTKVFQIIASLQHLCKF
jgi:hypothetical protein